jgi:MarR family transcriptional regulator, organic hydroperoxide resistance regulator
VQLSPAGHLLKQQARSIPPAVACATQCELHDISELTQRLTALRQQLHQAAA